MVSVRENDHELGYINRNIERFGMRVLRVLRVRVLRVLRLRVLRVLRRDYISGRTPTPPLLQLTVKV